MAGFPIKLDPERAASLVAAGFWSNELITDFLDRIAAEAPSRVAFIDSRSRISYLDLQNLTYRLADALLRRGVGPGDVVAIQLPNWIEFAALHFALVRIGAITCPITPMSRSREVASILRIARAKKLIIPQSFRGFDYVAMAKVLLSDARECTECIVLGSTEPGFGISYEALLQQGSESQQVGVRMRELRPEANAITEIVFTSGATGEPKGVIHSHNTLLAPQLAMAKSLRLERGSVLHVASTIAHQTGFLNGIRLPVQVGGTCVFQDIWRPDEFIRLVAKYKIEVSSGSATFLLDLLRCEGLDACDLSSFRIFRCGGGPIPLALVREAEQRFPALRVLRGWGQTENGVVTLTRVEDEFSKRMETDGCPQPGMEIRVVDAENRAVSVCTNGRLQCRGASMFLGYANSPGMAEESYVGDWFDTGDLATLDAEGYIRITGRVKDIVIRGGENIPVHYVENAIFEDPRVLEVCIVGMPDARLGERVCAFVICRSGSTITLRELCESLEAKGVAAQYWPEHLKVVESLPRTANGKIRKAALREQLEAGQDRDCADR
jgi:cyclohexanecarboxylate-CoA ligase